MRRILENGLSEWFRNPRRKPLILRGARQVGKSTLIRNFARQQQLQLIEINLERHPRLNDIFKTNAPQKIFFELEALTGQNLHTEKTLLFLDEIQATPYALAALRYLHEDFPDIPIVSAGSLLEFVLASHNFSMPVGRIEYLHLGPMTFIEFLWAMNENDLSNIIQNYQLGQPFASIAHERLLERQRQFLFIGGMPESILAYSQTKSLLEARKIHRTIIQTYQDDFPKYSPADRTRNMVQKTLDACPRIIGKKMKFTQISRDDRANEIRSAVDILIKARLLLPVYHTDCSGIPLKSTQDDQVYKVYFLDVGLFNYLCGLEWSDIAQLGERELINEGVLAEQFVAQHLAYRQDGTEKPQINYWLRESKTQNAEVDFVISKGKKIIPIEVKAGKSGSLRSLQHLILAKNIKSALRLDLNLPSQQAVEHHLTGPAHSGLSVSFNLISFPLYFAQEISRIVSKL
ncbi:MAG: ATP-binding protein [Deltaproteobacteria bacterium]|nr:ATP-binding protein [Deltaproteobacteria bacterium]